MSTSRLLTTIFGAFVALIGLAAVAAGGGVLLAHGIARDADGFYTSGLYEFDSPAYAISSEDVTFGAHPWDWWPEPGDVTFRVTVESADDDAVFVGIADRDALAGYLDGVEHDVVTRFGGSPDDVSLERSEGSAPNQAPEAVDLWEARVQGTGQQTLTWDVEAGAWALVVMNADGSPELSVAARAGVRTGLLLPIGVVALVIGLLVLGGGVAMVLAGVSRHMKEDAKAHVPAENHVASPYPVRIEGHLDPNLSPWRWLVKWFLAIPHLMALAFLWVAFALLTVVAGFAIVFTGRYPRGIFDFNVGVLRWTWRVTYYAFGVLGTDRYPPFSLQDEPEYPARLDVEYPEQLSRGLVLVKWWLLAIPHYLIVGVFTGGAVTWAMDVGGPDGARLVVGGGLIGVLVLVAGGALLFTRGYPRALYDFVMGLQRWVYRVGAYAALMTDEYPPFRLDPGGSEPRGADPGAPDEPTEPGGELRELAHT